MNQILFNNPEIQEQYEKERDSLIQEYKRESKKVMVKPTLVKFKDETEDCIMFTLIFEGGTDDFEMLNVSDFLTVIYVPSFEEYEVDFDDFSEVLYVK